MKIIVKHRMEYNSKYSYVQLTRGRYNGTFTSNLILKRSEREALEGKIAITWYNHEKLKRNLHSTMIYDEWDREKSVIGISY